MPTPPKPFTVLQRENKSHRTKAELNQRKQGEKVLSSNMQLNERPEVYGNPLAHTEFLRITEVLGKIEKNDAIYEAVINRYCLMQAECTEFEQKREKFYQQMCDFEEKADDLIDQDKLKESEYYKIIAQMQKTIIDIDKQVQSKRKMLLDIEKENIMTIASALRSIPKKTESKTNALIEAIGGDK